MGLTKFLGFAAIYFLILAVFVMDIIFKVIGHYISLIIIVVAVLWLVKKAFKTTRKTKVF
jgi:hypothetical protein